MESFLLQASIYLAAAVIAVPVAKRAGLGSILGYLVAGVLIGPVFGLVGNETKDLQHFAEFGVVMMLFIVGLELEPKALWEMRHRLIGLGGLQVVLTTLAVSAAFITFGQPWNISVAIGLIFALSSTAIVVQTLNEKRLMQTHGGRSAFSVLLTQDIAVIPMLALIPLLAVGDFSNFNHGGDDHSDMSLIAGLPGWGVTLVTLGAVGAVILFGIYCTRPIFHFIAKARLPEIFTAVALLLVVGIALLMTLVGLSPALGTFLAGVVLANSEYRHELETDIQPFKGLLLGLFFITVGAGINFAVLWEHLAWILGMTLSVMLIKGLVLAGLSVLFKLKGRDQWLFILSLAQAGEFGFVMLSTTVQTSVIPFALSQQLLLIIALSMLLTPLLFILYDRVSRKLVETPNTREEDTIDEEGTVIIAGIGRFGQIVNRLALATGIKTVVIDHQIDQIDAMRRFGVKGYFGDPTRPDMMHAAGLMTAKILVVAVDDKDAAVKLVDHARKERPDLYIIARAYDRDHVYHLYRAGADEIIRETFDSAMRAGKKMLQGMGWPEYEAERAHDQFFEADRHALAELAGLWDPNLPNEKNDKYVARAREVNSDLYTSFLSNLTKIVENDEEIDFPPTNESADLIVRTEKPDP
ncbi:monovalent cation:proton antiporter-2 (CPA2) family protein [Neptunicoccus sediminis]|uniref:monovalent cation:proton antiporter-2 (CPA2) family protein n=1 Tax=Neptunicoccus sediminis TaxID=1892596 RepID=UPI000845C7E8|nr:monovalent cation:proton antiporter-2 (CPA2) family protein [Neptunicoccus sediminis]